MKMIWNKDSRDLMEVAIFAACCQCKDFYFVQRGLALNLHRAKFEIIEGV